MRTLLLLLVILTPLLLACGCQSTRDDADREKDSQLPWSMPAKWENTILGAPY
jgi:hypothetical protein